MISVRVQHSILLALIACIIYSSRNILHMALLGMVERADTVEESDANENATCYHENLRPNNSQTTIGIENDFQNIRIPEGIKFDWTESKIGILQAAYYFGYIPAMIPGTSIGIRVGYFNYVSSALFLTSLSLLTFPLITETFGFYGAVVSRALLGVIHGPITSILSGTFFYWSLQNELTTLNSIYQAGVAAGLLIPNILGGPLLSAGYSWRAIFYAFFGLTFFTFIVFFIRASEKPEEVDHPLNKFRPLRFSKTIDTSEVKNLASDRPIQSASPKVKWCEIIKSSEIWYFTAAWFASSVTLVCFHTYAVRFMQYYLFIAKEKISQILFIQSIVSVPLIVVFASISDVLRKSFSTQSIRKAFYVIPSIVVALAFGSIGLFRCDFILITGALVTVGIANGVVLTVSCKPLPNELGGKYASQVYAFTNTIGSFAGIFAPMICGILLDFGPIYEFESWYGPGIFAGSVGLFGALLIVIPNLGYLPFTNNAPADEEKNIVQLQAKKLLE